MTIDQKNGLTLVNVSAPEQLSIRSLCDLEYRLKSSRQTLREIATNRNAFYQTFNLPKTPRPFAKEASLPKSRTIDKPVGELFAVQKQIYHRLLRPLVLPDYICGGVRGRSVAMNVGYHKGASLVVTMDIKSWFPSISEQAVYRVWRHLLKCSHKVAKLLTVLTTFDGHLPQGAPTSTALANLVLYSIDEKIREAAAALGVTYTSWVDDLPFSGPEARQIIPVVIAVFKRAGFKISRSKLKVLGPSKQRVINGVVIGGTIPQKHRRRIRAALHRLRTGQIAENETEKYITSLNGRITYLESINANQAKPFRSELDCLLEQRSH